MRTSASPLLNPSGLVDKRLQPWWDQIEQVRLLLPQIAHVSYYLEELFNLQRNLDLLAAEGVDHHILKDIQIFQGANAYEIALAEGFTGDVSTWLASLVGPKGDPGALDEEILLELQTDIQTNANDITALQAQTATLSDYTPLSTYNSRVSTVDATLASLQSAIDILEAVPVVIPRTDLEIQNLAQGIFDTSIVSIENTLSSLSSSLGTLTGRVTNTEDSIDAANLAFNQFLIENDDALSRITSLEASSDIQGTSITNLQTVTDNAASAIETLQANGVTFASQISTLQTVTSNNASQINTLVSANNDNAAAIETEATTRADAISATTGLITTLTSRVGDAEAEVTTIASTLADIEGNLAARYAIAVDGGGNGAFVSLEDGSALPSKITLSADKIELDGDVLITGSVTTSRIGENAVTDSGYAYTAAIQYLVTSGNTEETVQSVTVTTNGGVVHITANMASTVSFTAGNSCNHWIRIYRNSTVIYQIAVSRTDGILIYPFNMTDAPAAGTYTYYVKVESDITGSLLLNQVWNRYLSITEMKR